MGSTYPFFNCSGIPRPGNPLLTSAGEKSRWAEMHLEALQANIWGFFHEPGHIPLLRADLDPQTGYHIFRIKSLPDYSLLTTNVALGIGDVIGNIRGALEHAVWSITNAASGSSTHPDPKGITFPIRDTVGKLSGSRVEKAVRPYVSAGIWDVILSGMLDQPYPGAEGVYGTWGRWQSGQDHPLRILQDLSNNDKHRLLPTVLLLPTALSLVTLGPTASRLDRIYGTGEIINVPDAVHARYEIPIEPNMEVMRQRFIHTPEPHIEDAGQVTPHIAFQDSAGVVFTLDRIVCFVKFLLSEFERALP